MIDNIINSQRYLNINNKKNTIEQNDQPEDNKFEKYLSDYIPKYTGDEGISKKCNYKEMTVFEKRIFDHYMQTDFLYGVSYEDFKKTLCGFPPVDAPKSIIEAYQNTISKYPENQRKKIMGELSYLESPNDNLDMGTIIKNAIEHCKLVEIITGQSQKHRENLYEDFLNEFNKVNTIDDSHNA
ncbi:hypothetical protein [Clostridium botulinum]|uniref:Uncharacterized protein n=2 Tax=Clostridium botulinum TaxID=1491 RepID=C1FR61_CLOBJ|nr:hypothetical protein [Clostridium botulinum]ACO84679.1 hypothetical protein CLM_2494 [Clostridium botulinum A2 str. Kyoto]AUN07392.1 hypothetical protein RSJ14_12075 [Clostridium botulinum]MBN3364337.1 hypothetical protein [Clostridium botulinum]MBN3368512.1 hypothetical protein [Clostridium botulinum]MBN3373962.1 hypothetical protein [Clostridium botulinum]